MADGPIEDAGAVHRHDIAQLLRLALAIVVVIALILIGLDNRSDVRIGYVIRGAGTVPEWTMTSITSTR